MHIEVIDGDMCEHATELFGRVFADDRHAMLVDRYKHERWGAIKADIVAMARQLGHPVTEKDVVDGVISIAADFVRSYHFGIVNEFDLGRAYSHCLRLINGEDWNQGLVSAIGLPAWLDRG